jgi:hypothetical protein
MRKHVNIYQIFVFDQKLKTADKIVSKVLIYLALEAKVREKAAYVVRYDWDMVCSPLVYQRILQ